ncbi:MAG: hypothetical protein RLZ98_2982 [Pseudomonadota bacterium]|jgi:hypothetical protein
MNKDIISGIAIGGVAIAYWLGADAIPKSVLAGQVGADGLPKLLAYVLGALALILTLKGVFLAMRPAGGPSEEVGEVHGWHAHKRAFGLLAMAIGYIVAVPYLGYLLSIGILMAGVALYNGAKPSLMLIGIAAAGAVIFYVLFVLVLNIPLPPGIWPSLL